MRTADGRVYRRNRRHLRQTRELDLNIPITDQDDYQEITSTRREENKPSNKHIVQTDSDQQEVTAHAEPEIVEQTTRRSSRIRTKPKYLEDYKC